MTITETRPTGQQLYELKPSSYFANSRGDIIDLLPSRSDLAVLEVGCGAGGTGRAALGQGKAARYVGIELNPPAAAVAAQHLTQVLVGNVEEIDLAPLEGQFDALVISEVLEHLTDPWSTLRRLGRCLKPGGMLYASSPNLAHWKVIKQLLTGRFDYADSGLMDRTHLRWFTPATYGALVEEAGLEVLSLGPVSPLRWKARILDRLSGSRLRHLLMSQIMVVARRPPDRAG